MVIKTASLPSFSLYYLQALYKSLFASSSRLESLSWRNFSRVFLGAYHGCHLTKFEWISCLASERLVHQTVYQRKLNVLCIPETFQTNDSWRLNGSKCGQMNWKSAFIQTVGRYRTVDCLLSDYKIFVYFVFLFPAQSLCWLIKFPQRA